MDKVTDYSSKLTPIERKNSPRCFYFQGDFSLLEVGRRVSVVGSRKISEKGLEQTNIFVKKLIELNICIVSGLAQAFRTRGVDQSTLVEIQKGEMRLNRSQTDVILPD